MAVIEALLNLIPEELAVGRIVKLGDFGSFSLSIRSKGIEEPAKFHPSKIGERVVHFRAGKEFRKRLVNLKFGKDPRWFKAGRLYIHRYKTPKDIHLLNERYTSYTDIQRINKCSSIMKLRICLRWKPGRNKNKAYTAFSRKRKIFCTILDASFTKWLILREINNTKPDEMPDQPEIDGD